MKKAILMLMLCGGCVAPTEAEKMTYNVIAPAHRIYVEIDPTMTAIQKQARYDLLETWRIAVGAPK
tara:strand:+ start:5482 stop:5679 length:198 start_codon:yes stop_codon:yes gene_type:complete